MALSLKGEERQHDRQRIGICDGRTFEFRPAGTEVDDCFTVEDNMCRLINNVEPELQLINVLLPIVLPSSPAIANTFVVRLLYSFCKLCLYKENKMCLPELRLISINSDPFPIFSLPNFHIWSTFSISHKDAFIIFIICGNPNLLIF